MITRGRNVCFVTPPSINKSIIRDYAGGLGFEANSGYTLPPLDNFQLAACIQNIFSVSLIDAQVNKLTISEICDTLLEKNVDLVICELSLPTLNDDLLCAEAIASHNIIVIGKIHTTDSIILQEVLKTPKIECCLIGECEDNISNILLGQDHKGTARFVQDKLVVVTKEYIPDLNLLPIPRHDLGLNNNYSYPKLGRCTTILSSRGCPYSCSYYCPYPLVQGHKWRFRSSQNVINELIEIKKMGIQRVLFRDPVFSLSSKRVIEICNAIIDLELNIDWWCETRADLLPDALIELMAKAGCKGINIGVESGDSSLREAKLKQGISNQLLLSVAQKSQKVGIKLAFLLMIGFPGETRKEIFQTAILIKECKPYSIGISYAVCHPGTEFEKDAIMNGLIIKNDIQYTDGSAPYLKCEGASIEDIIKGRQYLYQLFEAIATSQSELEQVLIHEIEKWANET